MIRRTSEQWLALIEQYKTSCLTLTKFAKQPGIDPSYFRQRKRQLLAWQQDDNHGFVELTPKDMLCYQPMLLKSAMSNCICMREQMRCRLQRFCRPCPCRDVYRQVQILSA
jgi:hypothetical protein